MSDRGSGFGAFLMGGLIGAAVGLLYAPRAGRETRQMLVGEGQDMLDQATTKIRDAQDKALAAMQENQTKLEALNAEAKDRISKLQDIAEKTLNEQKESLKKGYSEAKKVVKEDNASQTAEMATAENTPETATSRKR